MTPRRKILLAATALMLLAVGWFFLRHSNEPKYEGNSVSYWYQEFCRSGQLVSRNMDHLTRRQQEALDALRVLRTNALPYLFDQEFSTNVDSAARTNLIRTLGSLPHWLNVPVPVSSGLMRRNAGPVIRELKSPADPLLALMEKHLQSTNFVTNSFALYLLGGVGDGKEKVLPYLVAALKRNDYLGLRESLQSLEHFGASARPATPDLVAFLERITDTNSTTNFFLPVRGGMTVPVTSAIRENLVLPAAKSLGNIGSPAASAITVLNDCFQSTTNVDTRDEIAFELCRIDPGQTNALDYLAAHLKHDTNPWLAATTAKRLGELGPGAMPAVPVLIDALNDGNEQVQTEAATALKKLGVPTKQYLPTVKADLKSPNVLLRFRTAMRVMQFEPGDRDAHLVLLDQANERSAYRYTVVTAFGEAGPAAKDVAPALRELLKSKDDMLRSEAAAALKKIEAPEAKK